MNDGQKQLLHAMLLLPTTCMITPSYHITFDAAVSYTSLAASLTTAVTYSFCCDISHKMVTVSLPFIFGLFNYYTMHDRRGLGDVTLCDSYKGRVEHFT